MVEIKNILFPCDLTENSAKIVPYVISVSEKYNSLIYLIHVVQNFSKWGLPYMPLGIDHTKILADAGKSVDKVCEEELQDCPNERRILAYGDPAIEILKTIESENIDLVIMGTHSRKGLEHTIFGSVAENVVKRSPVPVLVINPHRLNLDLEQMFSKH